MTDATYSLCPVCLARIPARRVQRDGDTYIEKTCAAHGSFSAITWRGEPRFDDWARTEALTKPSADTPARLGCPYDCGLCDEHEQSACCVIVDVTERCDMGCTVCFADSGADARADVGMDELAALADSLAARHVDYNIQLSGGEPCMREDLCDVVQLFARRFSYVQLNTNGARLAAEPGLAQQLRQAGLCSVFLNFAGTDDAVYRSLNGRPLLDTKLAALNACAAAGLPVVLVMPLICGLNTDQIGAVLDLALRRAPHVRGIHFLPAAGMGRTAQAGAAPARFTLPELICALERQSGFRISRSDLVPLVSGDCACSFHGHFLAQGDRLTPLTAQSDAALCACKRDAVAAARNYLAARWGTVPAADVDAESLLRDAGLSSFSITAMAFMDAWNFDTRRVKKCRLQVAARDGRLIPFCAYHVTSVTGERLYG